jgi:hypothetical protein
MTVQHTHLKLTRRRPRILVGAAVLLAATAFGTTAGYAGDGSHRRPGAVTTEQALKEYRQVIIALYGPQTPYTKRQSENCQH